MNNYKFQQLLKNIKENGEAVTTRNDKVLRIHSVPITIKDTPLITLRRTAWKSALREMEWFLSGSNQINDLHPSVQSWWKPWANKFGFVMHNYSNQFREFCGAASGLFDQIAYLQESIRNHPNSRRAVITTWNTADMISPDTPITNCHGTIIQCFVNPDNTLDLTMYQRSSDVMLGLPHNWIQYWAFLMWLAHHGGREVGKFTWIGGDVHVYEPHLEMMNRVLDLDIFHSPAEPQLIYTPTSDKFLASDFTIDRDYKPVIDEPLEMIV
jgi:thymidylate synthase